MGEGTGEEVQKDSWKGKLAQKQRREENWRDD